MLKYSNELSQVLQHQITPFGNVQILDIWVLDRENLLMQKDFEL